MADVCLKRPLERLADPNEEPQEFADRERSRSLPGIPIGLESCGSERVCGTYGAARARRRGLCCRCHLPRSRTLTARIDGYSYT